MNANEFARETYTQLLKIENNMTIMLYLGELFKRMMEDIEQALAEERYFCVGYGMKHDLKDLLGTMMDLTVESATVAKGAGDAADKFEVVCSQNAQVKS